MQHGRLTTDMSRRVLTRQIPEVHFALQTDLDWAAWCELILEMVKVMHMHAAYFCFTSPLLCPDMQIMAVASCHVIECPSEHLMCPPLQVAPPSAAR